MSNQKKINRIYQKVITPILIQEIKDLTIIISEIETKPIKEFLLGNVAESKQFTGITMSDGSKLSDFCKTYIKEKLPEYLI